MAVGRTFICDHCARTIDSWDEGDSYYVDADGKRRYAYHPDPERELCTNVESLALCLGCGEEIRIDSAAPVSRCPRCDSTGLVDAFELDGARCPYCRLGAFRLDPEALRIS